MINFRHCPFADKILIFLESQIELYQYSQKLSIIQVYYEGCRNIFISQVSKLQNDRYIKEHPIIFACRV
jgi:hypothetical protein